MDVLGFDGQKGPIRDFTFYSIRCVYHAELILTWQIVYLSSKEACPTISINKSEIGRPWTAMELAKIQHPENGSP